MNPELFYTVPKPVLAVGAAVVAVACANTARLVPVSYTHLTLPTKRIV